jgi:LmbE family N-acetylglucosaminyl deacetylase
MAILAHPDDESLGFGGTLAKYAAEGVKTSLITATRGQRGRFRGHPRDSAEHPGAEALAVIRERELRDAAAELGISDLTILDYMDSELDQVSHAAATAEIAPHIRRLRPDVVITFGPEGAYGHPDHIAISQLATAAVMAAADPNFDAARGTPAHRVSKFYYLAWDAALWAAYEAAFRALTSTVDGVVRQATPWPSWALTTVIDTRDAWATVWRAVSCHQSQITAYEKLSQVTPEHQAALWGTQSFYRVLSFVNGGRQRETDLFEGLR